METTATPFQLSQYRVVKTVTRSILKLVDNKPVYVLLEDKIFQADQSKKPKMVKDAAGNDVAVPPPFVVNVKDLETNQPKQMVCNEVFRTEIERQYKDGSYVGKVFELIKYTKAEGKNYNTFGITELALSEPAADVKTTTKK